QRFAFQILRFFHSEGPQGRNFKGRKLRYQDAPPAPLAVRQSFRYGNRRRAGPFAAGSLKNACLQSTTYFRVNETLKEGMFVPTGTPFTAGLDRSTTVAR